MMRDGSSREIPTALQYRGWRFDAADCLYSMLGTHKEISINYQLRSGISWVLFQSLQDEQFQTLLRYLYERSPDRGGKL